MAQTIDSIPLGESSGTHVHHPGHLVPLISKYSLTLVVQLGSTASTSGHVTGITDNQIYDRTDATKVTVLGGSYRQTGPVWSIHVTVFDNQLNVLNLQVRCNWFKKCSEYCKSGNFRENLIFKRHICDV